ncbi:AAA family ATPase [Streptococcus pluranimalium]
MRFYADTLAIHKFRKFESFEKDKSIKLGKKITVFAGQNGVGKSNVLSLIASTFGITNRRNTGGNFHPEFSDFFTIPVDEDYSDYTSYLKVVNSENSSFIQKRHSYKDDSKEKRGIRLIPRNTNYFTPEDSLTIVNKKAKDLFDIGASQRIPLPSIFISLSRLFPIGETTVSKKNIRSNNIIITSDASEMYKKWYNEVLPNSIKNDEILNITKDIDSKRTLIHMSLDRTFPETQSVGQDNIGYIISAMVDFYLYKKASEDYRGGILCIDEIDASLHPNAQLRLFRLLERLGSELELQIFMTTHSLTILKEIPNL